MILRAFHDRLRRDGRLTLRVKVRAGARESAFVGSLADGTVKVAIAAMAKGGRANAELIRFLAQTFAVPQANLRIVSGHASPRKHVRIVAE